MKILDSQQPIDIVYLWVDGNDRQHQQLMAQYSSNPVDLNPERTRDIYSMLKYSLRSVEAFFPWANNIYIITMRPQVPSWLDQNHPRIRVVHHDEIFQDSKYLPTFNCHALESYMHRIPGLSDYFVYMSDDYLYGDYITRSDFFDAQSRLKVYSTLFGEKFPYIHDDRRMLLTGTFVHIPYIVYKPFWVELLAKWADPIHETRMRKFRSPLNVTLHGLYRYFLLKNKSSYATAVPVWQYTRNFTFHKVTNNLKTQKKKIENLSQKRPKFFCLNDDQRDYPNPEVVNLISNFLDRYYPKPSSFERKPL